MTMAYSTRKRRYVTVSHSLAVFLSEVDELQKIRAFGLPVDEFK